MFKGNVHGTTRYYIIVTFLFIEQWEAYLPQEEVQLLWKYLLLPDWGREELQEGALH